MLELCWNLAETVAFWLQKFCAWAAETMGLPKYQLESFVELQFLNKTNVGHSEAVLIFLFPKQVFFSLILDSFSVFFELGGGSFYCRIDNIPFLFFGINVDGANTFGVVWKGYDDILACQIEGVLKSCRKSKRKSNKVEKSGIFGFRTDCVEKSCVFIYRKHFRFRLTSLTDLF